MISSPPPRRLRTGRLIIASHNPGKVREIGELIGPYGIEAVAASALGLAEPEETGASFIDNAILKALASALASGLPALADDSGLVVPALSGQPGIHSARWGGPAKDFQVAMRRVADALAGHADWRAHFTCALALAWPDGHCEVFEGHVHGHLVWPPRGERGFGYDPMFIADGHAVTFGEMDPPAKHAISHRAAAFHRLIGACLKEGDLGDGDLGDGDGAPG